MKGGREGGREGGGEGGRDGGREGGRGRERCILYCLTLCAFSTPSFHSQSCQAPLRQPAQNQLDQPPPSHTRTDAAARPVRELQGPPVRQNTGPTLVKKKAAAKCEPSFNFNAVLTWLQSQCLDHVLEHEISPCT